MSERSYEYENNVEVEEIKISESEYNKRVKCVIKCLLEMSMASDKTEATKDQEKAA